jgi:2-iminobutanoate/2-iminopropanoate deaminase
MDRQVIHPEGLHWNATSSPVIRAGDLLFVSSCTGVDTHGTLGPDMRSQTEQAFDNIKTCLEAAGSSFDKIVKTKMFLTDFDLYGAANEVYARYFSDPTTRGTRSTLQPEAMPGPELIAIEAIATLGDKQIVAVPGVTARRAGVASAVRAGEIIFAGGIVGNYRDAPQRTYGPDLKTQTVLMMDNLKHLLTAGGVSMDQLARVLLLVNDRADFNVVDDICRGYFTPGRLPSLFAIEHPSSVRVFSEQVEVYADATIGTKEPVHPHGIFSGGPWSPAVRAGGFVFVSGLTGRQHDGRLAADVRAQTRQTLENIQTCLEAAGSSLGKVIRTLVFLADIRDLAVVDEVYADYLGATGLPTRTAVQMNRLSDAELITIEAMAII